MEAHYVRHIKKAKGFTLTTHAPILGKGSICRLSMLGSAPHVPTNIGVVGECPLCEFLGGWKI